MNDEEFAGAGTGERIATPVCGLARNDNTTAVRNTEGDADCHASVSTGSQ